MAHDTNDTATFMPSQIVDSFRQKVIERIHIVVDGKEYTYAEYLTLPDTRRSGDEANAVDLRFTLYSLEWLGFTASDWVYNEPVQGQKGNRPDYLVRGSIGVAFIWEDKNSTLDLNEIEHLAQMRRYSIGTAGYAVWCNMRRLYAVRFSPGDALKYDILADVSLEELFGSQTLLPIHTETQATNLALFKLLFSKGRFTQFSELIERIGVDEQTFEDAQEGAVSFEDAQTIRNFITGSRESLNHLRLAALSRIQEALARRERLVSQEKALRQEWEVARDEFIDTLKYNVKSFDAISKPVFDAIERLTPQLGEIETQEISKVKEIFERVAGIGVGKASAASRARFEKWLERALHINSALLSLRFISQEPFRIADAYRIWSERQNDKEDMRVEIFAEQVSYVFFVRLLLIRVLEDKHVLRPRLASDGGFLDWSNYVKRHFKELDGIGILNENYCNILARKAGQYYLHFFQQAIFDWFNPDDFLLVETLEFLCRYNFRNVTSDIIGFTYEEYIERNARNRKGHFLTRPDVVEYMLDVLDYSGPQIIGRRICDPACGSGSFLVHAARRYRRALVTYFCNTYKLQEAELYANQQRRVELAHRYLNDLIDLFYGMEMNPFACYLAEMNLLIQSVDDLAVLQDAGDRQPIERFQVFNTDSLDLPREVLDTDMSDTSQGMLVPDRLIDEAYPIKAKLGQFAEGFFYIISNPPYVNSRQEDMDVNRYKNTAFYRAALSGDTNLYLLFLRLGTYYLSDYGQMVYIIPLTIFGDRSASAIRKLLKTPPFNPDVAIRFYRGDILFPGVDQAVGIVRITHSQSTTSITISGGLTIQEARAAQFTTMLTNVIEAVPQNGIWQGNWLVADSQVSLDIWEHTKRISANLTNRLTFLLDEIFDIKQGDINATMLNPLRLGPKQGSFSKGHVAIYKGEDIKSYAPLPILPSDWAMVSPTSGKEAARTYQVLEQLKQSTTIERGIILRQVTRLNTRERLIASWFERKPGFPSAFTNESWRILLKSDVKEQEAKAMFALLSSKIVAYLVNLFSTNNHVNKDELDRLPTPDLQTLPVSILASLANQLLGVRGSLERDFVVKYSALLPEFEDGRVYVPPSSVLAAMKLPKLTMASLVGRGEVKNSGPANGRMRALRSRNVIVSTIEPTWPYATDFAQVLALFLLEPAHENETWGQAQSWLLPDPVASASWLAMYTTLSQQAQAQWELFVSLQKQVDHVVADWYGFDERMRAAIAEGLPWARRRRNDAGSTLAE